MKDDPLFELLGRDRLTAVVDIGANPIDGDPPYKLMLARGLCTVTGFEPQEDALAELNRRKGKNECYLPDAIGDGGRHPFYICHARGMSSLLKPDQDRLAMFNLFPMFGKIETSSAIKTRRLDDVGEIEHIDFLKIDIQGGELEAIRNGKRKLAKAVAIQAEVSFIELYCGQPSFGEFDLEMRRLGFVPHCFAELKLWPIAPAIFANDARQPLRQLLEADVVYVRDISRADGITGEQWKHLPLIAHHCYGSVDLALRAVINATHLGCLPTDADCQYLAMLPAYAAGAKMQGA